jgi:hypothetical protein
MRFQENFKYLFKLLKTIVRSEDDRKISGK